MTPQALVKELKSSKAFFDRSSRCLVEEDSEFSPVEGTFTAAQHIGHCAQTVDWFLQGAFRPEGFDLDFEKHIVQLRDVRSIKEARAWLDRSYETAMATVGSKSIDELLTPITPGPVMGGEPRLAVVAAIVEHTAHHRGALTVYSRLRGHVPAMPYMEVM